MVFLPSLACRQAGARRGFTLVEMIVALSVITLIFGLGLTTYQNFFKRQIVEQVALSLISDLQLEKDKALSGEKPSGWCDGAGETLLGWRLDLTTSGYSVLPACSSGVDGAVFKSVTFPAGISAASPAQILFKVLGQGVNGDYTIILSDLSGNSRAIRVVSSGLINVED